MTNKTTARIRMWVNEQLFGFFRGLGPRGATSRNAWYLYQDLIWLGFTSAASSYINVYAIRLGASEKLKIAVKNRDTIVCHFLHIIVL